MEKEFNSKSGADRSKMSGREQKLYDYIEHRSVRETQRLETQWDAMKQKRVDALTKANTLDNNSLARGPAGPPGKTPQTKDQIEGKAHSQMVALRQQTQALYPRLKSQLVEKHASRDSDRQERRYQQLMQRVRERSHSHAGKSLELNERGR